MIDIYELPTLPKSLLRTSSPTSGGPSAPSGSFGNLYGYALQPYEADEVLLLLCKGML